MDNGYPPGFSELNDYGTRIFEPLEIHETHPRISIYNRTRKHGEIKPQKTFKPYKLNGHEILPEKSIKVPRWIVMEIPLTGIDGQYSEQNDRLRGMVWASIVGGRQKIKSYDYTRKMGKIKDILEPFMLSEFLDFSENQKKTVLDTYRPKK